MTNYFFSASLSPTDGNDTFFLFKETLKAVGFTVPSSSNGTIFSAGDILSSSADFGNNSWFIVRQPQSATASHGGVQREYAFQRSTNTRTWRGKYSYSSSFTGSANATTLPDAPDQVRLIGAELPSFAFDDYTLPTDGTYKLHIAVDQDPPHSFYFVIVPNGGGEPVNCLVVDAMLSGTFPSTDNDPYVQYWADLGFNIFFGGVTNTGPAQNITSSTITSPACWTRKGESNQIYGGIGSLLYSSYDGQQRTFVGGLGTTNGYNNKDDLLPLIWFRSANANPNGPGGYKGISSLIKIPSGPDRSTGDTYSTTSSGSKNFIRFGDMALVWNGTDPVI